MVYLLISDSRDNGFAAADWVILFIVMGGGWKVKEVYPK